MAWIESRSGGLLLHRLLLDVVACDVLSAVWCCWRKRICWQAMTCCSAPLSLEVGNLGLVEEHEVHQRLRAETA